MVSTILTYFHQYGFHSLFLIFSILFSFMALLFSIIFLGKKYGYGNGKTFSDRLHP